MRKICFISILFLVTCVYSQEKNEYEKRVTKEVFPQQTSTILDMIPSEVTKIRYYEESDGEHKSYEAKFKFRKLKYSVEFSTQGMLEDVEVTKKFRLLPSDIRTVIQNDLDVRYERWRVEKAQLQYTSEGDSEKTMNNALSMIPGTQTGYELIVVTKVEGKLSYFEVQYSEIGEFRQARKVIRRSYDFVLF